MSKIDLKRDVKILKLLNAGNTYISIAKKFGVSKQRIYQIAQRNNCEKRWEQSRERNSLLYNDIMNDIKNNISIDNILKKYSLTRQDLYYALSQSGKTNLLSTLQEKRDQQIVKDYFNGYTAKEILEKEDSKLAYPKRLYNINSVYRIVGKNKK